VSILQERQSLGALAAVQDEGHGAARFARYAERWVSLLAGQAMPVGTTLALVWLATVGLVVINYFVAFNLVTLIYMLPVVVAATQWGLGPGIVAAVAGRRLRISSSIRRSTLFGSETRKTSWTSCCFC
jgi:hypothetical protein